MLIGAFRNASYFQTIFHNLKWYLIHTRKVGTNIQFIQILTQLNTVLHNSVV